MFEKVYLCKDTQRYAEHKLKLARTMLAVRLRSIALRRINVGGIFAVSNDRTRDVGDPEKYIFTRK